MTPEQERLLNDVHSTVVETKTLVAGLRSGQAGHEDRLDALEGLWNRLKGGYWLAVLVGPIVASVITWLVNTALAK